MFGFIVVYIFQDFLKDYGVDGKLFLAWLYIVDFDASPGRGSVLSTHR